LKQADRIFFIHHGTVWEEGTHADLMAKDGPYATMYRGWEQASKADAYLSSAGAGVSVAS
jgi:ABC-type transport system involved in cytochrome bd biosynthesis fused ATPase/permease subunit